VFDAFTRQFEAAVALGPQQVTAAVAALVDEAVSAETKAAFLTALAKKGESTEEIAAFARELRDRAVPVPLDAATRAGEILDVCGRRRARRGGRVRRDQGRFPHRAS